MALPKDSVERGRREGIVLKRVGRSQPVRRGEARGDGDVVRVEEGPRARVPRVLAPLQRPHPRNHTAEVCVRVREGRPPRSVEHLARPQLVDGPQLGALAIEGKQFDYQTNDRLRKALEMKLFEDQKETIKLTSLVSSVVDKETQAKIDIVKERMIRNYGYNDESATDVLNFVASVFARGDSKESS